MATVILESSKGTTVPLRLITRSCPGAVADKRVGFGFSRVAAGVFATPCCSIDSLPVCIFWAASETPLFGAVAAIVLKRRCLGLLVYFWPNTHIWGFSAPETPR